MHLIGQEMGPKRKYHLTVNQPSDRIIYTNSLYPFCANSIIVCKIVVN